MVIRFIGIPVCLWVVSTWEGIWTLILFVSMLSVMCLGKALEQWGEKRDAAYVRQASRSPRNSDIRT